MLFKRVVMYGHQLNYTSTTFKQWSFFNTKVFWTLYFINLRSYCDFIIINFSISDKEKLYCL